MVSYISCATCQYTCISYAKLSINFAFDFSHMQNDIFNFWIQKIRQEGILNELTPNENK